jgi:hypothetical protein
MVSPPRKLEYTGDIFGEGREFLGVKSFLINSSYLALVFFNRLADIFKYKRA